MMSSSVDKAAKYWSESTAKSQDQTRQGLSWLHIPRVRAHINTRISGSPDVDWIEHSVQRYLKERLPATGRALSLGCGSGWLERHLSQLGGFQTCDAFDAAPGSIEIAKRLMAEEGCTGINYEVRDINQIQLLGAHYDIVWINSAMHHFERLEHISEQLDYALKPDGIVILNEYVGPNRFQFPPAQKDLIVALFSALPSKYRKVVSAYATDERERSLSPMRNGPAWLVKRSFDKLRDGDFVSALQRRRQTLKVASDQSDFERAAIHFPSERDVIAHDPTEAVRSQDIVQVVRGKFDIVARCDYGGNLLHYLLGGIAGNFTGDDPESLSILDPIIAIEEALIESGAFASDFTYIVAQKRGRSLV